MSRSAIAGLYASCMFTWLFFLTDFRGGKERGREGETLIYFPLIYAVLGWFLHVPWSGDRTHNLGVSGQHSNQRSCLAGAYMLVLFRKLPNCVLEWLSHFTLLPAMQEWSGSSFSASLPAFGVNTTFCFSHSDRSIVVLICVSLWLQLSTDVPQDTMQYLTV